MFKITILFLLCSVANASALITDAFFMPTSFWYQPIPATVTINTNNAAMVADLSGQAKNMIGAVKGSNAPIYLPGPTAPIAKITPNPPNPNLTSMWSSVPLSSAYSPSSDNGDYGMAVYDKGHDIYYETWGTTKATINAQTVWQAKWGGQMKNASLSNGIWPSPYGSTATGLPYIGGQVTADELNRGEIKHVIGIALVNLAKWNTFSWPANRSDGNGLGTIPEGARFRFDPTININSLGLTPWQQTIVKAGQIYGFVVWDSGANAIRFENPLDYTTAGKTNPYIEIFGADHTFVYLQNLPWSSVQFLPTDYGKP
jgi:hypothetical protein